MLKFMLSLMFGLAITANAQNDERQILLDKFRMMDNAVNSLKTGPPVSSRLARKLGSKQSCRSLFLVDRFTQI